jgi:formate dehydrogenase subunit gamma
MNCGRYRPELVAECIERYRSVPGGLLPLLQALQRELGYIPPESVAAIATGLNLSRAEVHGVISFYHDFHTQPVGRHRVQICRAEACQAMGGRALENHARERLGLDWGETTADGAITLEPVYCLGNCACSPSVRIDDAIHARIDTGRLDTLLAELRREESPS